MPSAYHLVLFVHKYHRAKAVAVEPKLGGLRTLKVSAIPTGILSNLRYRMHLPFIFCWFSPTYPYHVLMMFPTGENPIQVLFSDVVVVPLHYCSFERFLPQEPSSSMSHLPRIPSTELNSAFKVQNHPSSKSQTMSAGKYPYINFPCK